MRFKKNNRDNHICWAARCSEVARFSCLASSFDAKSRRDPDARILLCEKHAVKAAKEAEEIGKTLVWDYHVPPEAEAPAPAEAPAEDGADTTAKIEAAAAGAPAAAEIVEANPHEAARVKGEAEGVAASQALAFCQQYQVNAETSANAGQLLKDIKGEWKRVDGERKLITKPLNDALKAANDFFRPALTALKECENVIKVKLAANYEAQELEKRKQLAALQTEAQAGNVEGAADAALAVDRAVEAQRPKGASFSKYWTYELIDADKVPRELCSPDNAKIMAKIRGSQGEVEIPGCRVFEETRVAQRG